jgi:DNA-binding transcriptional MerR regulator
MALKPGKLFYSITEVAEHFKVAPSLLRYWESEFNAIQPRRNAKGTRSYTTKDIDQLSRIHLLVKEQGYTLAGAKERLKKDKKKVDKTVSVVQKLEDIKSYLEKLKAQL